MRRPWLRATAAALVVVLALTHPAHANAWTLQWSWSSADNPMVGRYVNTPSSLVGGWQYVLSNDISFPCSGIDGYFGPYTQSSTKTWQSRHGLTADGVVGPLTWGRAGQKLGAWYGNYWVYFGTVSRNTWYLDPNLGYWWYRVLTGGGTEDYVEATTYQPNRSVCIY